MIPENAVSFSYTLKVGEKDIDALKHVNNVVYLKWLNDISEQHWKQLATPEVSRKYLWVVLRHELDYLSQAKLDQEITLITWVGDSNGVKSVRHVQAFNGDTLLFKARSTWCLLDAKTLSPARIKEDILSLLHPK